MLAYIDVRPWILIIAIPLLFIGAWLIRRRFRPQAGYITILSLLLFGFLAAYQFILYGPFIDQHRVVSTPATWTVRNDLSPPKVAFTFTKLPYGGLLTSDRDVLAHVSNLKSDTVSVSVELTYDFGRNRGMNLNFAYVDGILFYPESQ
jgi:hypothetical protein